MIEATALTVSLIVFLAASVAIALGWDQPLFYLRPRALLIALFAAPISSVKWLCCAVARFAKMLLSLSRFTIRDALWFTLVAGLILGWLTDHERLTGRYLPHWPVVTKSSKAKKPYYDGAPRDIDVLAGWSRSGHADAELILDEWKRGLVHVKTVKTKEEERSDQFGKRLVTNYESTIHRGLTGETFRWTLSHSKSTEMRVPKTIPTAERVNRGASD